MSKQSTQFFVNLMFQSQSGDTDEGATGGEETLGDSSEKEHEIEVDDVSLQCLFF